MRLWILYQQPILLAEDQHHCCLKILGPLRVLWNHLRYEISSQLYRGVRRLIQLFPTELSLRWRFFLLMSRREKYATSRAQNHLLQVCSLRIYKFYLLWD